MSSAFHFEDKDKIVSIAADTKYAADAFLFVLYGIYSPVQSTHLVAHISTKQFCENLRDIAFQLYGDNAQQQLAEWAIHTTEDFGSIMYLLIENGFAFESEEDSLDQFSEVYDFDVAFAERPRKRPMQFSVSLLFIVTTIVAIYFSGARISGAQGAVSALFTFWIGLIGGAFVFSGLRNSGRERLILLLVGFPLLFLGLGGFCLTVVW